MPKESSPIEVREHTILHKFDGDPEEGRLLETVEIENGRIVNRTVHSQDGEE